MLKDCAYLLAKKFRFFCVLTTLSCSSILNADAFTDLENDISQQIRHIRHTGNSVEPEARPLWEQILVTWETLLEAGEVKLTGKDKLIRPVIVLLQSVVEACVANKVQIQVLQSASGCTLTPLPPTPLRTYGDVYPGLVDPSIAKSRELAMTVQKRALTLRQFLTPDDTTFDAIYTTKGWNGCSQLQKDIFLATAEKYPNLCTCQLPEDVEIDPDLVGATLIIVAPDNEQRVFQIHTTQAINPKNDTVSILRYGPPSDPRIQESIANLQQFFQTNGVPINLI